MVEGGLELTHLTQLLTPQKCFLISLDQVSFLMHPSF